MLTHITQPVSRKPSQAQAEDYLTALQALALELERAMEAVVANSLRSFEESLVKQRSLCERLASLSKGSTSVSEPDVSYARVMDGGFSERILEASAKLHTLNDQYSALLKHSGDTLRMFAGLFRSYSAPTRVQASQRISINTWSCEL